MSARCLACARRPLPAPGGRFRLCGRHSAQLLAEAIPATPAELASVAAAAPPKPAEAPRPSSLEQRIAEYAATLEREGYSPEEALRVATEALGPVTSAPTEPRRRAEPVISRSFLRGVLLEQAGSRRGGEA